MRPERLMRSGRGLAPATTRAGGYSLIELVFVIGLAVTVSGIAVPQLLAGLDDARTSGAAHYISTRMQRARMEAITRSVEVAVRFTQANASYRYGVYVDGNRNGVVTKDIASGIDRATGPDEGLADHFSGVDFGAVPGIPPVDAGGTPPGSDPIRLGASNLASFSPSGTATSGSLYIRGRQNAQYVVRIYGDTGKIRILKLENRTKKWKPL